MRSGAGGSKPGEGRVVLRGVTPLPCSQAVGGGLFHRSPRLRVAGYLVIHTQPGIQVNLNSGHLPIQTKSINAAVTERKKTGVTSMDIAITKGKHVNHGRAANVPKLECVDCISKVKCSCVRLLERVTQARA